MHTQRFVPTTKIKPRSLAVLHRSVYFSLRYGGLRAALASSVVLEAAAGRRSSMKTSLIRLLITFGLTGAYDLLHSTTPEVVRISKVSSMFAARWCEAMRAVTSLVLAAEIVGSTLLPEINSTLKLRVLTE